MPELFHDNLEVRRKVRMDSDFTGKHNGKERALGQRWCTN